MTIKAEEFDRIVEKLGLKTRRSGDPLAWLEHEGRIILRTRRSQKKGDLPFQHSIRQQLKLNEEQLRMVLSCSLGREDYIATLEEKGLL